MCISFFPSFFLCLSVCLSVFLFCSVDRYVKAPEVDDIFLHFFRPPSSPHFYLIFIQSVDRGRWSIHSQVDFFFHVYYTSSDLFIFRCGRLTWLISNEVLITLLININWKIRRFWSHEISTAIATFSSADSAANAEAAGDFHRTFTTCLNEENSVQNWLIRIDWDRFYLIWRELCSFLLIFDLLRSSYAQFTTPFASLLIKDCSENWANVMQFFQILSWSIVGFSK